MRRMTRHTVTLVAAGALAVLVAGCAIDGAPAVSGVAADTSTTAGPFSVQTLETTAAACLMPQKVGRSLYLGTTPAGEDRSDSLVRLDIEDGTADIVEAVAPPEYLSSVDANDRWLVWERGKKLHAMSLSTGERQLVSASRALYAPALSGDLVAWVDLAKDGRHQLTVRDLSSGATTVVAPIKFPGLYNNFPAWDGATLAWTDIVDDAGRYRLWDSTTGGIVDHVLDGTDFRYPGYAVPAGDRIYSINFDRTDEWDWSTQKVGFFSAKDGRFTPIVPEGFIANRLAVFGDYVAIVDDSQRLSVRRVGDDAIASPIRPLAEQVDSIAVSSDGTLVAWRQLPGQTGTRIILISPADEAHD
jgi:hypothetical protein